MTINAWLIGTKGNGTRKQHCTARHRNMLVVKATPIRVTFPFLSILLIIISSYLSSPRHLLFFGVDSFRSKLRHVVPCPKKRQTKKNWPKSSFFTPPPLRRRSRCRSAVFFCGCLAVCKFYWPIAAQTPRPDRALAIMLARFKATLLSLACDILIAVNRWLS